MILVLLLLQFLQQQIDVRRLAVQRPREAVHQVPKQFYCFKVVIDEQFPPLVVSVTVTNIVCGLLSTLFSVSCEPEYNGEIWIRPILHGKAYTIISGDGVKTAPWKG